LQLFTEENSTRLEAPLGKFLPNHSHNHRWNNYRGKIKAYKYENGNWIVYRIHQDGTVKKQRKSKQIPYKTLTPIEPFSDESIILQKHSRVKQKRPRFGPSLDWDQATTKMDLKKATKRNIFQ